MLVRMGEGEETPYVFKPFLVRRVAPGPLSSLARLAFIAPRPRSGHRVVCDEGCLYSFGGYNPNLSEEDPPSQNATWTQANPLFKELWSFSFARGTWRLHDIRDTIPEELASNAACINGKTIMIYGGTGSPFGFRCSNRMYTYHVSGEKGGLQLVETKGEQPPPQYGQTILCYDGYLYTIGGTNGLLYNCDIHRLNLRTSVWEPLYICYGEDEPMGRYRHELAFDGTNLYILAGGTAEWAFDFLDIPIFSLETLRWSFRSSKPDPKVKNGGFPLSRKCHSAVQINSGNKIFVFIIGGCNGDAMFNDIWRLEIPSLQWTLMKKSQLPKRLYFHSSAVTPSGCMYTFGGIRMRSGTIARTNLLFKSWLCIPKLSEISWESLLHYYPNLVNVDRSDLLKSGVPLEFVNRITS